MCVSLKLCCASVDYFSANECSRPRNRVERLCSGQQLPPLGPHVEGFTLVILAIGNLYRTGRRGYSSSTHDVTTCYINIPQDDLITRMISWIMHCWNLHTDTPFLQVSERKGHRRLSGLPQQGEEFYCRTMRAKVHVLKFIQLNITLVNSKTRLCAVRKFRLPTD